MLLFASVYYNVAAVEKKYSRGTDGLMPKLSDKSLTRFCCPCRQSRINSLRKTGVGVRRGPSGNRGACVVKLASGTKCSKFMIIRESCTAPDMRGARAECPTKIPSSLQVLTRAVYKGNPRVKFNQNINDYDVSRIHHSLHTICRR